MKRYRLGSGIGDRESGIASGLRSTIHDSRFTKTAWALLLSLALPALAMACPACKEALFDPSQLAQRLSTAKGYALSIALLLSVPALLIGGITALIIRAARRRSQQIDTPTLSR